MSIRWRPEAPTKAGFYYWQGNSLTGSEVAVVQVTARRDGTFTVVELLDESGYRHCPVTKDPAAWGGNWAGPLPQPT